MNVVGLVGRLYGDPVVRYTKGENSLAIASFGVACERKYKKNGEQNADFISCKAIGKLAEFVEKYLKKGTRITLVGRIQTGSYEKDGQKIYTTEVLAEEIGFAESKNASSNNNSQPDTSNDNDGFVDIPDGVDEELPFK